MSTQSEFVSILWPVLKGTGKRIMIRYPIFENGYDHSDGHLREKGIVRDPDTGKRYIISGSPCGFRCRCDAWAVEIDGEGAEVQQRKLT